MCNFISIVCNRQNGTSLNARYLPRIMFLYSRYAKYLEDDYASFGKTFFDKVIDLVERCCPFFWAIEDEATGEFAGFVYLDNIIGTKNELHSAELTTCFEKAFWGDFTKSAGRKFVSSCFEKYGFKKIKAQIYPHNFRVKTLLKAVGFEKEGFLRAETMRDGRLQDVEVYSVLNEKIIQNAGFGS